MAGPALVMTVSLPGLPSYSVGLSRLRAAIADWRPFWTDTFAPFFYREVLTDFVLEGGNSGDRWAPLASGYAKWKSAHYPGAGMLVRSGALKAALTSSTAEHAIFRATSDSLEIGTDLPYAMYHQRGTRRMPQRPPLRVNEAFMRVVGRSMQQYVQQAWKRYVADGAAA